MKKTKTLTPTLRTKWRPKTQAKNRKVKPTKVKIKSLPRRPKAMKQRQNMETQVEQLKRTRTKALTKPPTSAQIRKRQKMNSE